MSDTAVCKLVPLHYKLAKCRFQVTHDFQNRMFVACELQIVDMYGQNGQQFSILVKSQ